MKLSLILLILVFCFSVTGQWLEQTDWSGGPGEQGPQYDFYNAFWISQQINWSTTGKISLEFERAQHNLSESGLPANLDFPDTGTLESSLVWMPMGTDWEIAWGNIEWISNEPVNTSVSFQLRTGMTPETMGEWTDPITESGTFLGAILPDTILLIQYRANLNTTDSSVTPELEWVQIEGWYPGGIEDPFSSGDQYEALSITPNPSFGSVTVNVNLLSSESFVYLRMYDLAGKLIRTAFEGELQQGSHSFIMNEFTSGIYFVRLESDCATDLRKVVILE
ncbi:MAG: T9SS type A sorting domain-containing protein [Candidatus Aegiribacteria sp.]|nr:T9SS type A sorting domain-containing protein [Candidatus Aegiribacteria sp.]